MVTKLEEKARRLVALWLMKSTTSSFGDRAGRRFDKTREEIGGRLKEGDKLPEDSELVLRLGWRDEAATGARKTNLALKEFGQVNPEALEQLQGIIKKHRQVRRAYVEFGGEVSEEVYIKIIREIMNVDYDRAQSLLESMDDMATVFGKDKYALQTSLLSE